MDPRDWFYLKVFVGLYVVVTLAAALGGAPIPAWRVGIYGAVAGTLVVAVVLVGRSWVAGRASS